MWVCLHQHCNAVHPRSAESGRRGGVWVDVLSARVTPPCPSASHSLANVMPVLGGGWEEVQVPCEEIKAGAWRLKKKKKKGNLCPPVSFDGKMQPGKARSCAQKHTGTGPAHSLCSSGGWGLRSFCQMAQGLLICRRLTALRVSSELTHTHALKR